MYNILYVDDEPALLEIAKLFLEQDGQFSVDIQSSASAGLFLLTSTPYDVIISDYQMPEMNGIEFLKKVRTTGNTIPFILFTGRGREEVVIQALNAGADFYLQKGGEPESQFVELAHMVRIAAFRKRADDALRKSEEKYRHLIQHSDEAIIVVQDRMLKLVNNRMVVLSGYSEQELLSLSFLVFIHPDDRDWVVERYQKRLEGEKVPSRYSFRLNPRDASIISVEISVTAIDWDGRPATLSFLTDITDRKRAEEELLKKNEELTASYEQIAAAEEELRGNLDELTRQELALRESEQRFRKIFENSPVSMALSTPDFRFFSVNPAMVSMTGYSKEELLQLSFKDITHPDHVTGDLEREQELAKGTIPVYTSEKRYIRKDGSTLWGLLKLTTILDEQRTLRYFCAQIEDITERKRGEIQIKTSETRYRRLFESAKDGILILIRDTGEIIDANPFIESLIGYTREELIGKPLWDTGFIKEHAASKVNLEELKTKEYIRYDDLPLATKDGRRIEVEFVSNVYPVDNASLIQCNIRAVAGRKRAELELVYAHEKLNETYRVAHIGTWDWVMETDTVTWSEELYNIAGRAPSLPAPTYAEHPRIYKPASWERLSCAVTRALTTGEPYNLELELVRPDGSTRWTNAIGGVNRDGNGKVTGLHGLLQDITERKQVEHALALTNRKLNLLSGITRHDINNQITTLMGFLRILEKKQPDPSLNEYFQKISTAALRISAMIRFTKEYESIGVTLPIWQDCRSLVDTAAKEVPLGKIIMKNDLPAGAEVFADPLIARVFYNLMDNAVRYGGKITTIRFSAEEREGDRIIVCEDDGEGIPCEEKEKIFERGFGKNTGLGLSLVREILSITGIGIHEIGEPGNGARFEITVPRGGGCIRETEHKRVTEEIHPVSQ